MAVDYESLSDEQLKALLDQPAMLKKQAAPDYESMSDEQLQTALKETEPKQAQGTTAEQETIAAAENRARPRMTITGEFTGGIGDIAEAIGDISTTPDLVRMYRGVREALADPKQRNVPGVLGALISSSPVLKAGLGAARTAFSPFARLSNLTTSAGQVVSDLLQKAGLTTAADIAGAGTQIAGDVVAIPRLLGAVGKAGRDLARAKLPLRTEQTAKITAKGAAQEADITRTAEQEAERVSKLREAQLEQVRGVKKEIPALQKEAEFSAEAQKRQLSELADKEIKTVRETAAKQESALATTQAETEKLAEGAPVAKQVGEQFRQEFKIKKAESTARFNTEYNDLIAEGASLESSVPGYKKMADAVFKETGTTKILPTKAEREAAKINKALTLEDDLDTTYGDVRAVLSKPDSPELNKFAEAVKAARIKAGEIIDDKVKKLNVGELIIDRQRLKRAERAARDTGQGQVAVQLGKLRNGIEADISEFQNISTKLRDVDKAYGIEHAPFYSYGAPAREAAESGVSGIIDRLVPKAGDANRSEKLSSLKILDDKAPVQKAWINEGVFEANKADDFGKAIVKHWDKYSEPGDEVLRALLDDKYTHVADIVDRFRKLKPKDIDDTLGISIKQIENRTATGLKGIETRQLEKTKSLQGTLEEADVIASTIYKRAGEKVKRIEAKRDLEIKGVKKSIQKDIEKITGKPWNPERARGYGMLLIMGGIGGTVGGLAGGFAGAGAGMLAGANIQALTKGGIMILGAETVGKLLNTAKGASLVRRAVRTVPGTAQAAATARQIQTYLKDLDKEGQ